jgi:hypothetical protein
VHVNGALSDAVKVMEPTSVYVTHVCIRYLKEANLAPLVSFTAWAWWVQPIKMTACMADSLRQTGNTSSQSFYTVGCVSHGGVPDNTLTISLRGAVLSSGSWVVYIWQVCQQQNMHQDYESTAAAQYTWQAVSMSSLLHAFAFLL